MCFIFKAVVVELKHTPWKGIFTSKPYFAILIACMAYDFFDVSLQNELPKYMKNLLGYNTNEVSVFVSVPYLACIPIGIFSGILADYFERNKTMSVTINRKIFIILGLVTPVGFGFCAVVFTCHHTGAVAMFMLATATLGFFSAGWANFCDIAPGFASFITAIANTLTACQGFLSSLIVAAIIGKEATFAKWSVFMAMVMGYAVIAASVYAVFGSGERQQWDIVATGGGEIRQDVSLKDVKKENIV